MQQFFTVSHKCQIETVSDFEPNVNTPREVSVGAFLFVFRMLPLPIDITGVIMGLFATKGMFSSK